MKTAKQRNAMNVRPASGVSEQVFLVAAILGPVEGDTVLRVHAWTGAEFLNGVRAIPMAHFAADVFPVFL
jgi:hypothetical protein